MDQVGADWALADDVADSRAKSMLRPMSDEPPNLMFEYLRRIEGKIDRTEEKVDRLGDEVRTLSERMANVEEGLSIVNRRLDRLGERFTRIERRVEVLEGA